MKSPASSAPHLACVLLDARGPDISSSSTPPHVQCFFPRFDPQALGDEQALEGLLDLYLYGVLSRPVDEG